MYIVHFNINFTKISKLRTILKFMDSCKLHKLCSVVNFLKYVPHCFANTLSFKIILLIFPTLLHQVFSTT